MNSNNPNNQESTVKIAVLFTDIVGSTDFFKTYGDIEGKKMLQRHYDIATSIISRFNGKTIKFIGDSIMAAFSDPKKALHAAIFIQQKTQLHNKKENFSPINTKIGIHYGNVIIENNDIYGDIVNVASKLTNLTPGGEIYISKEVYDLVKDSNIFNFESIIISDKNFPQGLIPYKVNWNKNIEFNPEDNTIICLHPILSIANPDFLPMWNKLIKNNFNLSNDKIKEIKFISNNFVVLFLTTPTYTIDITKNIVDIFLQNNNIEKKIFLFHYR